MINGTRDAFFRQKYAHEGRRSLSGRGLLERDVFALPGAVLEGH
jgi:hypothetical protein